MKKVKLRIKISLEILKLRNNIILLKREVRLRIKEIKIQIFKQN